MTHSDIYSRRRSRNRTVTRFDLLLLLLPLPLFAGVLGAVVSGGSVVLGAGVGGVPSAALLGYCLFVDGPTDRRERPPGAAM